MMIPVIIKFKESDYRELKEEANSIPTTLSKYLKKLILDREENLEFMKNYGYALCKKDYGIETENNES